MANGADRAETEELNVAQVYMNFIRARLERGVPKEEEGEERTYTREERLRIMMDYVERKIDKLPPGFNDSIVEECPPKVEAPRRRTSSGCEGRIAIPTQPHYEAWVGAWHAQRYNYIGTMGNDCPACSKDNGAGGKMRALPSKSDSDNGTFWGCNSFPHCRFSSADVAREDFWFLENHQSDLFIDLPRELLREIMADPRKGLFSILKMINCVCPTCGKETLVVKRRRGGGESSLFLACSEKSCKFTLSMHKFMKQIRWVIMQKPSAVPTTEKGYDDWLGQCNIGLPLVPIFGSQNPPCFCRVWIRLTKKFQRQHH